MTVNQALVKQLFDAKAHLGHKSSRVHPKAKKYIYTTENDVSIIDLTQTTQLLEKAVKFVEQLAQEKKVLLVVATKKIAAIFVQKLCQDNSLPFITNKWPAGLLSNFETITKNIKKLIQMNKDKQEGSWQKFVKHDRLRLEKQLQKLERGYGGLIQLEKLPDAIFVIDIKKEKNAVTEALRIDIPVIAVVDTNVNLDLVNFHIPANDDSQSSIEYLADKIISAYAKK